MPWESFCMMRSPLPDVDIPDVPITEFVLRYADLTPDRIAICDGLDGTSYTYAALRERIHRLAGALAAEGVGPGAVVALMASNCPDYAVVFHAVAVAGATLTTVNPTYTPEEVRFQLIDSRATWAICVDAALPVLQEAISGTEVEQVVTMGEGIGSVRSLASLDAESIAQVPIDVATHVVVLPYSSGTTGLPKGVMLSHRNLVANLLQTQGVLAFEDDESAIAFMPFFHIYGMQVLMNALLAYCVEVVTLPRFDLVKVLDLIQTQRITRLFVVPPIVLALAKHPIVDNYDLSSLRHIMSGAAPMGAEITQEAESRVGCPIGQGYGMTELSPVSHVAEVGDVCYGSSGRLAPNTECRIVDVETGVDCPAGEPGEMWVRGPQVMLGYLNNAEATADMITPDGWLRTGDISIVDEAGYMTVVDRLKELIKVKGFQVAPAELEALLLAHPAIADAAVIGVLDEESGEIPKAFVVLREPGAMSSQDVESYISGRVTAYKRVRQVEFVESIPKSASGKILRRLLRTSGIG